MTRYIDVRSSRGSYTLEAAIFLPLVVLAVLSLGYFMKVTGAWENCIHGAVDESARIAAGSIDRSVASSAGVSVSRRINDDNPELDEMRIKDIRIMYSDGFTDDLTSYRMTAGMKLELPLGFSGQFDLDFGIKYRGFTGRSYSASPLGAERLQQYEQQNTVWIFPHSGERYHGESCTYVKASVSPRVLTSALMRKYKSCGLCDSDSIARGSVVFCFSEAGSAYHRGSCSSIVRHVSAIDRSEAIEKGYTPCTKCGGS
ncbi:MAG: hypothetical protein UIJ87_04750 [Anaerovoracaceae bacterium]|nr:hypothetical protein [Anaerovoracaceae bacterium]